MLKNHSIKLENFGTAGAAILISKCILVHLEPDCAGVIIYNVYLE